MKTICCVLGLCLPMFVSSSALSDACSDLQVAMAKATALRQELLREAAPINSSAQMPVRHEGVCNAAQKLRDHIVMLAKMIDSKCLSDEQQRSANASVDQSMREANSNIGLFCN
jgi:hypothetical protein